MKWARRIGISLFFAFFAICCSAILLLNWSGFGYKALTVSTGSMEPTIPSGSMVWMHSVPNSQLKVGDVITYTNSQNTESTITHRIIRSFKINGNVPAYITKGDANPSPDPLTVVGGQVRGKAVWHVPHVGHWLNWAKNPIGILALIYIPALIIMIEEVRRLTYYFKSQLPYISAEMTERLKLRQKPKKLKIAPAVFLSSILITASILVAFPVHAVLRSNTVSLANNNLSLAATQPPGHILIKSATFECSQDNSPTASRLLEIIFYNPTNSDINTSGWHVESSSGTVVTMRNGTMFDARDDYDIEPDIPLNSQGWVYSGDFLALFDAQNNLVDGISWGSDTSQLNPSLPATVDGNDFRRVSTDFDTNTTADWDVNFQACSATD